MYRITTFPKKGRGLQATEFIKSGTLINQSPVVLMNNREYERYGSKTTLSTYVFHWDDDHVAVAMGDVSLANHSNQENTDYRPNYESMTIDLWAIRDIQPGEEITDNYGWTRSDFVQSNMNFETKINRIALTAGLEVSSVEAASEGDTRTVNFIGEVKASVLQFIVANHFEADEYEYHETAGGAQLVFAAKHPPVIESPPVETAGEKEADKYLQILGNAEGQKLVQNIFKKFVSEEDYSRFPDFMFELDDLIFKYRGERPLEDSDQNSKPQPPTTNSGDNSSDEVVVDEELDYSPKAESEESKDEEKPE